MVCTVEDDANRGCPGLNGLHDPVVAINLARLSDVVKYDVSLRPWGLSAIPAIVAAAQADRRHGSYGQMTSLLERADQFIGEGHYVPVAQDTVIREGQPIRRYR